MSDSSEAKPPEPEPKASGRQSPMDAAKELTSGVLGTVQTRLELLSNELAEERARIEKMILYGVVFLGTGIITMVLLTFSPLVFIQDPLAQDIAFGFIFCLYFVSACVSGFLLRKNIKDRGKPFQHTIEELKKDRDRLGKFVKRG